MLNKWLILLYFYSKALNLKVDALQSQYGVYSFSELRLNRNFVLTLFIYDCLREKFTMIFKQFFDPVSKTLTYLIAKSQGAEALIIDPVLENVDEYLEYLGNNSLKLVVALDTHIHADHKTGLGKLRSLTRCMTCMSEKANTSLISRKLKHGDIVSLEGVELKVIYTPGHTDDSCCFYTQGMVFTGDTLFIRGNGRTDFQHGDAAQLFESLDTKLFTLPDETAVWPGHDYKGEQVSTIGRERIENPRYAGKSEAEFVEIMDNLDLPNPDLMDEVLPFNQSFGKGVGNTLSADLVVDCEQLDCFTEYLLVDLRDQEEIYNLGTIADSILLPLRNLEDAINNSDHPINKANGIIFFCAHGERSVLGLELALEKNMTNIKHLQGGFTAWIKSGRPVFKSK